MGDPLQAIGEPRRRELLRALAAGERTAGEVAARFDVSRQAISQHLRILLASGLVEERREGTRRYYRARPEGLEDARRALDALWSESLPRLKQAAEAEARAGKSERAARAN